MARWVTIFKSHKAGAEELKISLGLLVGQSHRTFWYIAVKSVIVHLYLQIPHQWTQICDLYEARFKISALQDH